MGDERHSLGKVYGLYLKRGGTPAPLCAALYGDILITDDDVRNEAALYRTGFGGRGRGIWQTVARPLIDRIRAGSFDPTMSEYVDLACVQALGATALFQYQLELLPQFEDFVRVFDQVEMDIEKKALWEWSRKQ